MKNSKRLSPGVILLNIFLISTIALMVILLFRLIPDGSRTIVNIWIGELILVVVYCLFFYDSGKIKKNRRKDVSVLRH
jgi:hypothetical protein